MNPTSSIARSVGGFARVPDPLLAASRRGRRFKALIEARIVAAGSARMALRSVKNVLLAFLLLAGAAPLLAGFKDLPKYPVFERAVRLERALEAPALSAIRAVAPTNYEGSDIARPIFLGLLIVLALVLRGFAFKFDGDVLRLRRKRDYYAKQENPTLLAPDKMDRTELLQVYAEVKKSLDQHKQFLAFLSIDVVDSTGMKVGEDPGIAENDFRRYKRLVERVLAANHAMKSAWTPDGVMICFPTAADAVRAAQGVINGLESFNLSVKHIKRDFSIRAGVNAGEVFCDAATPMAEMTDRVIDVAGHMQKHGIIDGIAISKHAIEPHLSKFKFKDAGRAVDGFPVYEWKKGDPS